MRLLIVDDEELTRTGVIAALDWRSLGVDEILQADDGIHGLEMARRYRPEIILCDVRMPRMDGTVMLQEIEKILPDTVAIFMSGYSDKEYLKAAIRLKAVNYIEKPLNPSEIRETFLAARELYRQKLHSRRGETLYSKETSFQLARQFTVPYGPNQKEIERLSGELGLRFTADTVFTAFILQPDPETDINGLPKEALFMELQEFLGRHALQALYTEKHLQYLVFHVFGETRPAQKLLEAIGGFLGAQFAPFGKYAVAAGDSLRGLPQAFEAYASAVVTLQSCFFFPANTFLTPAILKAESASGTALSDSFETQFFEALTGRNPETCRALLAQLPSFYSRNQNTLQNQAKDFYYKLLLALEDAGKQLQLPPEPGDGNIVDVLESCFNVQELHEILAARTEAFFSRLEHTVRENSTIFLIKDYISKNYRNELLSVKDISDHVFLSTSYVCTFFKNETGQTLNQYLTQYRMEKAKQLLADPRYKITDISSKVGYSDSNYFGKSFKKYCGLSPSEYRERTLSA